MIGDEGDGNIPNIVQNVSLKLCESSNSTPFAIIPVLKMLIRDPKRKPCLI